MAEASISNWQSAFDDLSLELSQTAAPKRRSGEWFEALAEFSRHSYARLLLSPLDDGLRIHLDTALGPPEDDPGALAGTLAGRLRECTDTDWDVAAEHGQWDLTTEIDSGDEASKRLRELALFVVDLAEHFDAVSSADEWYDIVGGDDVDEPADAVSQRDRRDGADSPFESISRDTNAETRSAASSATIEAWSMTRVGDSLRASVGFSQVLASEQLRALTKGLQQHIHAKFDAMARHIDEDDRAELRLPSAARTVLYLEVKPGGFPDGLSALRQEINDFFERLEQFSSYGVDLFEYLGVADTVLDGQPAETDDDESTLSFERRTSASQPPSPKPTPPGDDPGVVLDLQATPSSALEPKNYTDPRLQREDATTRLVDVVLRHPGYSDRRIGRVLSILLSIEYHVAVEIADAAPCVIAWGIGRKRAKSFKDVIEDAGGKVVLVEPGTFGEA